MSKPFSIFLTSVHAAEAAQWIRQYSEYLRPLWTRQPYQFLIPRELDGEENNRLITFDPAEEDYGCFDRTLVAYSASYDIDTSNIRYTIIDLEGEDVPCFRLLPPASPTSKRYSALELIAVMRSLRYNDSFRSISFAGVSLDALRGLRDPYGPDKDAFIGLTGIRVSIAGQDKLSLLSQEIRALSLKSRSLLRLDFSYCLSSSPPPPPNTTSRMAEPPADATSSDIAVAIFPVIRREVLTNVDWVVLNGIKLGEADLDYLVDAASQKGSRLRALEVGNCGLSVHDLDLLLSTMVAQEATLEAINISGLQGRLNPDTIQQYLGYFGRLRRLDLSSISRTSGPSPLFAVDQLLNWPLLEELYVNRTSVNRETTQAIAAYLASDESCDLRVLQMSQCGMTGEDVAVIMRAIRSDHGELHLHVNENRLDVSCSALSDAIAHNQAPSHLSMKMIDFKKEEHFRELVEAVRRNKTLKLLDISKASLPYDAGPETCRSLQRMLEENDTLEVLDISGESAHLDVARFGIGLNLALTGLKKNNSLRVLRIEHQRLGFQGASTLASVLEANTSLREVYCEFNEINLQSFTVLVESLRRNRSLLVLSCMDGDRAQSLYKLRREVTTWTREPYYSSSSNSNNHSTPVSFNNSSSMRRSIYHAVGQKNRLTRSVSNANATIMNGYTNNNNIASMTTAASASASAASSSPTAVSPIEHTSPVMRDAEIDRAINSLSDRWDSVVDCLCWYLLRNYYLALGVDEGELYEQLFSQQQQQQQKQQEEESPSKQQQQQEGGGEEREGEGDEEAEEEEEIGVAISVEGNTPEPAIVMEEEENDNHDNDDNNDEKEEKHNNVDLDHECPAHDLGIQFPSSSSFSSRDATGGGGKLPRIAEWGQLVKEEEDADDNKSPNNTTNKRSALKGFITRGGLSREKKRMDKLRNIGLHHHHHQLPVREQQKDVNRLPFPPPPRLDWSPPKLDLGFG